MLVTPDITYSLLLQARCHLPLTVTNEIAPCQIQNGTYGKLKGIKCPSQITDKEQMPPTDN